ncbi:hypothetical protein QBC39DRAFT_347230 [Podospora conica]|nr:hypothetical protein QBC39DRAFT_347230 [Schizothecium conicum]
MRNRITQLHDNYQALKNELVDQRNMGINSERALLDKLAGESNQRAQMASNLYAAIEATKTDLVNEYSNRLHDTTTLRKLIVTEADRCTKATQALEAATKRDLANEQSIRAERVQGLRDDLLKESSKRKKDVTELRTVIKDVSEEVGQLVAEKSGGVYNAAVHQPRDEPIDHHSNAVIRRLEKEVDDLRKELAEERDMRQKMFKILESVAQQAFSTHDNVKDLYARLAIMKDYTLLPFAEGLKSGVPPTAEKEGDADTAEGAADGDAE